jgi:uncharacterized membrane protein YfcA
LSALPPLLIGTALVVVFLAGVVRGFSGFGFSALCVAALSLFLPPARVVPPIFVLEIVASISLLRGAWPAVDWRWMAWLAVGNVLFIPAGVWVLAFVSDVPVRLLIGAMLLAAALAMRREAAPTLALTPLVGLVSGVVSGFFNGVAAIGGMAIAVLFSAAKMEPQRLRATLIVLFLGTDLYALVWAAILPADNPGGNGLLGRETLVGAMAMLPAMLAGIWVGQRSFAGVSPQQFRRHVLDLLAFIALVTVVRALWSLTG